MSTVIITEKNGGINSHEFWGYVLKPFSREETDGETLHLITLVACRGEEVKENVDISTFYGSNPSEVSQEACNALESLIDSINEGGRSWDVIEHNSNL